MRTWTVAVLGGIAGGAVVAGGVGAVAYAGLGPFCRPLEPAAVVSAADEGTTMGPDEIGFDGDLEDALEVAANASETACLTRAERDETLRAVRYTSVSFERGGGAGMEPPGASEPDGMDAGMEPDTGG